VTLQEAQALGRHASITTKLIYAHNIDSISNAGEKDRRFTFKQMNAITTLQSLERNIQKQFSHDTSFFG